MTVVAASCIPFVPLARFPPPLKKEEGKKRRKNNFFKNPKVINFVRNKKRLELGLILIAAAKDVIVDLVCINDTKTKQ